MRSYFLGFLESKGPSLQPFVATSIVSLLCRITKLAWFDSDQHRKISDEAGSLLKKGTSAHYQLGLQLLRAIVQEMHQQTPGRTTTQHRKTAVSFRDLCLLDIFRTSLDALKHLKNSSDSKIQREALSLSVACLSFDFVGTSLDDSAEDLATLQIPSTWRSLLEDLDTMQLYSDYYCATVPPLSSTALECLVRLASVRRSLFSSEEVRLAFLSALVNLTRKILQTQQGLNHQDNYHEFCRLLGRLKNNYQLAELVSVDNYAEWIERVAHFTVSSLQGWQWSSSSVHYLLALWTRLVSSVPYMKGDQPSLLAEVMPKIIVAYVTSRLDSVTITQQDPTIEDPLENEEQLQDQLESLPYLCRFQYEKMSQYICSVFDPLLAQYRQITQMGSIPNASQIQILEGQITWFVYMIGTIIRGRLTSGSTDSQELLDGELAARVFGLLQIADAPVHQARYGESSRQRLDVSILHFFQHFRKVYVGEQVMHSSKVYTRLKENVGLDDHLIVLNVILNKISHNLKCFGACDKVIDMTLTLFRDLTMGYMSGKLLSKLDAINFILTNHSPNYYSFLSSASAARNRTTFYSTLARMIFMEDSAPKFKAFTAPLQAVLAGLSQASGAGANAAALRASVPADTVSGLFRDLLGISQATMCRKAYMVLFDWLYPRHFPVVLACLEAWADTPAVTTPLLKFMVEFVSNKGQCMAFESSSPNGILLFREISKVLVIYSSAVMQRRNVSDVYAEKYKGIWLCLALLSRALNGSYVNFGVFDLYGDPALVNALEAAMSMALSVPVQDVMVYNKVAKAYFVFLEALCHNHTAFVVGKPHATFVRIIKSLEIGVKSIDTTISSQCAMAIDNLATWLHKHLVAVDDISQVKPAAQAFAQHAQQSPTLFPEVLQALFEIALFEECFNQWSLSRPMLSLILINEQSLSTLKQQLVASQPMEKQALLATCLDKLMKDVDRTLESKNRDRFTQNLTIVRHEYKSKS